MCLAPTVESALPVGQGGRLAEGTYGSTKAAALGLARRKQPAVSVQADAAVALHQRYTWADVAAHTSKDDCWIVVKDRVYDVTDFARMHPGGRVIYEYAGRDATDVFSAFHAPKTWAMLRPLVVGSLQQDASSGEAGILRDFRQLKSALAVEGLFRASKAYYAWKLVSTVGIMAGAIGLLLALPVSFLALLAASVLFGLGLQQMGWLSHDFNHNQVLAEPRTKWLMNYLTGNVLQGFSVYWWKNKHNTHHAVPNLITDDGNADPVDPDIDTLPFLAWSAEQAEAARAKGRWVGALRLQHRILWPLLLVARLSWAQQSFEYALQYAKVSWWGVVEVALLVLHYALCYGPGFACLPFWRAAAFLLFSQMAGGFFLGYVFVQSHNGMEVYSQPKDFATAQIVSTRDVRPGLWNDWFTGGLNYQIEHHLFPSLPRHNFHKVAPRVKALCEKHGLRYESVPMRTAVAGVVAHLANVAKLL